MSYNRELSQFASFVEVGISTIGITTSVGINTTTPKSSLQVDNFLTFESFEKQTTSKTRTLLDTFSVSNFSSKKYQIHITCPGQITSLGGITTGGRGYTEGTFNVGLVTTSGTGSDAKGTVTVRNGVVNEISISSPGTGYTSGDVLTASGGTGFRISVATTDVSGGISSLSSIVNSGFGYTSGVGVGTTTLTFVGGNGSGAIGLATVFDGVVTEISLLPQSSNDNFYSGSNDTTQSIISINRSDLKKVISQINGDPISGVSTLTTLTSHGFNVDDIVRFPSSSSNLQIDGNVDYYVLSIPSSTTFTIGTSTGIGTYVGFNTAIAGVAGTISATSGIITGITTTSISIGQYVKPIDNIISVGTTVTALGIGSVFINPSSINVGSEEISFDFGSYTFADLSTEIYRQTSTSGGEVDFLNTIDSVESNYQISEITVNHFETGASILENSTLMSGESLGNFDVEVQNSNVRLFFTPLYPNTTIKVMINGILE